MKKDPARAKPSEVRVRENLQNTLTRKFVDVAKDYQNRQVWMRERRGSRRETWEWGVNSRTGLDSGSTVVLAYR